MAATHMKVQNVIVYKRYVRNFLFDGNKFTVVYIGGRKEEFLLDYPPSKQEISGYEAELEDR